MARKKARQLQKISLQEHFAKLPDPKIDRAKLHSFTDILVIALEFAEAVPFEGIDHDYTQTIEKSHGRIETRQCWTITDPEFHFSPL